MESSKKSSVTSSMVDLKAELFRKQEEFKRQKAAGSNIIRGAKPEKNTKGSIWNQQNPGVLARAKNDEASRTSEEEDVHSKSRKALEQKARLYDKLCNNSTIPDEDGSNYYLVDFQKKVIDSIVEDREANRKKEAEEEAEAERVALTAVIPEPVDPNEEWIDFKDSLGRDRRCMKKDLDDLMKQDRDLALAASRKTRESGTERDSNELPSLMSSDMHREMMRQKWEDEMKELQEKGQQEIHYSNVQFDEIRSHGVGFFQFSKDHERREAQLEDLKKMREETVDEHSRKEHIKDKRKAMIEARLAKVRQRRNLKEPAPEVKSECDEDSGTVGPKLSEASLASAPENVIKKEEVEKQAEEKRKAHIREWDRGKQTDLPVKKNYVEVLRDEREPEFAPPSLYFEEPKKRQHQPSVSQRIKQLHTSLKTSNEALTLPTHSNNDGVLSSSRCDNTEDNTQGNSRSEEAVQEYISGPEKSQMGGQLPEANPSTTQAHQHYPMNENQDVGSNWTGSYSGYENVPYYSGQSIPVGNYGQTEMPFENPSVQQYTGYQHYSMPLQQQQQQQHHNQWQQTQYISSNTPHQQCNVYDTGNAQLTDFMDTGFSSGARVMNSGFSSEAAYTGYSAEIGSVNTGFSSGVEVMNTGYFSGTRAMNTGFSSGAGFSDTRTSASTQPDVDVHPRKPKIPKMAVVDTRYMKNEEIAPVEVPINASLMTAVPYIPGSFTAAKQATAKLYEDSVVESGLKGQISGNALLYTEDQLAKQVLLPPESDGESYLDIGIY
ncbi:unnamed protein product [Candidula unifasciata]|uniref:CCDC174 alpha/beta GRSR domain-containing protein n=1 Tax=Candidula unifasciata TaxID=100452 RepID=A0A8S4A4P2_9EUPU|nr:unnamed protein product [Candidula unifasciata]